MPVCTPRRQALAFRAVRPDPVGFRHGDYRPLANLRRSVCQLAVSAVHFHLSAGCRSEHSGPFPIPSLPESMASLLAGFELADSVVDMSERVSAFGVKLTTVEEFARQMTRGAADPAMLQQLPG